MTKASSRLAIAIRLKIDEASGIEMGDLHGRLTQLRLMIESTASRKEAASGSW